MWGDGVRGHDSRGFFGAEIGSFAKIDGKMVEKKVRGAKWAMILILFIYKSVQFRKKLDELISQLLKSERSYFLSYEGQERKSINFDNHANLGPNGCNNHTAAFVVKCLHNCAGL